MIAPKHLIYIPVGFAYSAVFRLPHEHPVTKQNTPPPSWVGKVSGTTAAQWPAQRNTPKAREIPAGSCHKPRHPLGAAAPTTAANDRIWSTEGIKRILALAFSSPARTGFGWASRGVWITHLSQLLITVNELRRKELATNLFAERSTLFRIRDSFEGRDWQYNYRILNIVLHFCLA